MPKQKKVSILIPALLVGLYLVTHLLNLVSLPVFADESIYIRWSQLIIDDWQQYLFFPLNDGKTPLPMWLMVPGQFIFQDPLWSSRLISVLAGLAQMFAIGALIKSLGGRQKTAWLGMALTIVLPFWYFHHRMALTDGLMTMWLTWMVVGLVKLSQTEKVKKFQLKKVFTKLKWPLLTGLFLGLALWSKLPAILFLPLFALYPLWLADNKASKVTKLAQAGMAAFIGLAIFASLKLHPAFSQLFGRGSDFLYPWQEVVFQGKWTTTIRNIPNYLVYLNAYLTWPILLLNLFGLFSPTQKKSQHLLLLSALVFAGPIALLGRVVYPRYLLPIAIFLTASAALAVQEILDLYFSQQKVLWKKILVAVSVVLLVVNAFSQSTRFIQASILAPDQIPFVSADKEQYLYEWSAGHGTLKVVDLIQTTAQDQTVAVATEGTFGTLPDGILMYLHRQNVDNIYVEGIGWPIKDIPEKFTNKAQDFDQTWLVVNSHRLEIDIPPENLLYEFCRPDEAPCLQVWDISDL